MSENNVSDDNQNPCGEVDKLIELDNVNVNTLLTPNNILDNVQMFDSTVEIVGYVDNIESPRCVGDKQQFKFFKFYLNNGQGRKVQVVAWNNDIQEAEYHIRVNHIIHLDGVQARPPKQIKYNNGNLPYELLIKSNTIISNLGKFEPTDLMNDTPPEKIELANVMNTTNRLILRGYVKTNFLEIYNTKLNKIIGCGALTDGMYKLEVHIHNFSNNQYADLDIKKGEHVEIIGIMQTSVIPPFLMVQSLNDIKKLAGHMPLLTLINGYNNLKRKSIDEASSDQNPNKKSTTSSN